MAAVLAELDYRDSAWAEHKKIATHILSGSADAAERAALSHALGAGRMMEERLKAPERAA
jgi:DNA-binding FadR family transcriptional regulator